MNPHYQDETKKKPLIQYHQQYQRTKYNQPTIHNKDKIKKDKSMEKQNTTFDQHSKRFKDFSKFTTNQYQSTNNQIYKKSSQNHIIPLTPSNIQINPNTIISNNNNNKNLTFGGVKNNQQQLLLTKQTSNGIQIEQPSNTNHIISVNVNIQNLSANSTLISAQDFNKKQHKFEPIKPSGISQGTSNLILKRNEPILKITNPQDQKRRLLIGGNSQTLLNTSNLPSTLTSERYNLQKTTLIEKTVDRGLDRREKLKKHMQDKFAISTSPVDRDFLCDQELDLKPAMDKKPLLKMQKKLSEKKLSIPLVPQTMLIPNPTQANLSSRFYHPRKPQNRTQQLKQLKQFQMQQSDINNLQYTQSIQILFQQQQSYMIKSTYLQKQQKFINWQIRAILVDWMRQLSYQYALKRDTYHLAVVLLDNFLSKKNHVQKQVAQVIGATTLFIASKLEELQCKPSQYFAESTQGICNAKDIQNWQLQICKTLQFKLNPPTIFSLANRIITQWDKYINEVDYAIHHLCFERQAKIYFKKLDEQSYRLFRQLMQYIDCTILDIQTSQYKPILIVLSILYLILGVKIGGFNEQQIYQQFPKGSYYLLDRSNYFNDLFENFMETTFGLTLIEILPAVQYTASFFNLNLSYEKPLLGENQDDLEQMDLEEYCSYQTYNRHMLRIVTHFRDRGVF